MKDLESRLKGESILLPLQFSEKEIRDFIEYRVCIKCGARFTAHFSGNNQYSAKCPEHGYIYSFNHINKDKWDEIDYLRRRGARDLHPRPKRTEKEILEELGF